ncbi:MAG: hypothetical protein K0U98_21305 [Deltaproteobacteria bacterium]|nr:hypothetical protein [Deltaproteobacteria bacterium]
MKTISKRTLLLLTAALVFAPAFAQASPDNDEQRRVKVLIADDGDMETHEFDLEDMYVGETREFTTDSGRVLEVTRTEDGQTITLDGEEINLHATAHMDHEHQHGEDHEHGDGHRVRIHKEVIVEGEDGDDDEGRKVRKIIRIDNGGGDVDIDVLDGSLEGLLEIDCEDGDEECSEDNLRARILAVVGDDVDADDGDVVIIKKRIRHEEDDEDED